MSLFVIAIVRLFYSWPYNVQLYFYYMFLVVYLQSYLMCYAWLFFFFFYAHRYKYIINDFMAYFWGCPQYQLNVSIIQSVCMFMQTSMVCLFIFLEQANELWPFPWSLYSFIMHTHSCLCASYNKLNDTSSTSSAVKRSTWKWKFPYNFCCRRLTHSTWMESETKKNKIKMSSYRHRSLNLAT